MSRSLRSRFGRRQSGGSRLESPGRCGPNQGCGERARDRATADPPKVTPYIKPISPHRAPTQAPASPTPAQVQLTQLSVASWRGLASAQTMVVANPSTSLTAALTSAAMIKR